MHNGGNYDFKFLIRGIAALRRRSRAAEEDAEATDESVEQEEHETQEEEAFEEGPTGKDEDDPDDELPAADVEDALQGKPWHRLKFSVLYKSGEKLLSFRLGCLQFVDSMNFYKTSLSSLMEELRRSSPDDPSQVFVQMSQLHPELQPSALTPHRRRKLCSYFAPDREEQSVTEAELVRWTWQLLLRKLPMPFEKMQGPEAEIWTKPAVWDEQDYRSSLNPESPEELRKKIKSLRETCEVLGFENFLQVHNCYLFMDLALSDVMEHFRSMFHHRFGIDPLQKISVPGAAFDSMLRGCLAHRAARLITDRSIYDCLRNGMMGGLSCIFNPRRRANSPELGGHYDPSQPTSFITSMDVSSMYPTVMCEGMPVDGGKYEELPTCPKERLRWLSTALDRIDSNNHCESFSYAFVVDYYFPPHLHDMLDWAPPCRMNVSESMLSPYTQELMRRNNMRCGQSAKLIPFLGRHTKEVVDGKRLAFLIRVMGAKVEQLHSAIVFKCQKFLAPWIRSCYQTRLEVKQQGRNLEAELLKLVMNSMYGKLIQRCEHNSTSSIEGSFTEDSKPLALKLPLREGSRILSDFFGNNRPAVSSGKILCFPFTQMLRTVCTCPQKSSLLKMPSS